MAARTSKFSYNKTYRYACGEYCHPSMGLIEILYSRLCWTLWVDKLPADWALPTEEALKTAGVRLLCCQQEVCPKTGRDHWQGYISLNKPFKPSKLMKLLGIKDLRSAWHAEEPEGNEDQNLVYCTKQDTRKEGTEPFTWGKVTKQGQRTDLAAACDTLAGGGFKRVAEQHPTTFVKYHRGLQTLHSVLHDKPRDRNITPTVTVLFGPTGTGKTREAFDMADASGEPYYVKMTSNKWWDGYAGEELVIIDEYLNQFSIDYFLQLLDRYPMRVEAKGTSMQLRATKWIITSNYSPSTWYQSIGLATQEALNRRITTIREFTVEDNM